MLINTRDFGKLDIDENEILTFKMPMLGYDEYEDYIVLFDEQVGDSFAWLQSIKNSALCFMLANPKMLKKTMLLKSVMIPWKSLVEVLTKYGSLP